MKNQTQPCYKISGGDCTFRVAASTLYTCKHGHSPYEYSYFASGVNTDPILWAKIRFDQDSLTKNDLSLLDQEGMSNEMVKLLARSHSEKAHSFLAAKLAGRSKALLYVAKADMEEASRLIAARSDLSPKIYEQLAASSHPATRAVLASNPYLPVEIMYSLANDSADQVAINLSANRSSTKEVLSLLKTSKVQEVIQNLINNSLLTFSEKSLLAGQISRSDIVQKIEDPAVIEFLIGKAVASKDTSLLEGLASNENLLGSQYEELLEAGDLDVSKSLMRNKSFPRELLSHLVEAVGRNEETVEALVEARPLEDYPVLLDLFHKKNIYNRDATRKIIFKSSTVANAEKVINIFGISFEKERYSYLYDALEMYKACGVEKFLLNKAQEAVDFVMA